MQTLAQQILEAVGQADYHPLKPKALARRMGIASDDYPDFKQTIRELMRAGKIELGRNNTVRLATFRKHMTGVFRSTRKGEGFVKPRIGQGKQQADVFIRAENVADAASGDTVRVEILKPAKGDRNAEGRIVEIIDRHSERFVGTYFLANGRAYVRVDGGTMKEDIYVGDASARAARNGDKVLIDMLQFPTPKRLGEGVIVEVLGPAGEPETDLISVIRQFDLPDEFSPEAMDEAREVARRYEDAPRDPERADLRDLFTITIDPIDAKDFDDAISVERTQDKGWKLAVHVADVATFVREQGAMDREARRRGTSVYLPGRVIPMLPELISNGLASLQEARERLTKTVIVEFNADGVPLHTEFHNSIIKVDRRLDYGAVNDWFENGAEAAFIPEPQLREMLTGARELALILRKRRRDRGFLELDLPAAELDYDERHEVIGAHYHVQKESHRLIEEFMLTANEAVATRLDDLKSVFLRRIHEHPDPAKLHRFALFAKALGYEIANEEDRFELQRIVAQSREKPERHALHYAFLRSMKEAVYGPEVEGHFALASEHYCHFTSPIRRYPDLSIHRLMDRWIRERKVEADDAGLLSLGEHCSFTERRAEKAERELVKIKILKFLQSRVGEVFDMIINGVEEFGFFVVGKDFPAEGLVHVRSLTDDHYVYDHDTHTLEGRASKRQFRLGDTVRCRLMRVSLEFRQVDFDWVGNAKPGKAAGTSGLPRTQPRKKPATSTAKKGAKPNRKDKAKMKRRKRR